MNTEEDIVQAYGTTWAGNGSDQLPTPTLFLHPGYELHDVGDGRPQPDDVPRNVVGPRRQPAELRAAAGEPLQGVEPGLRAAAAASTRTRVAGRLRAVVPVPRRPPRQRRPVPDRPRSVHQQERHPRRRRQPDQGGRLARDQGGLLLPELVQAAEHLRQLQQHDQLPGQRQQPVRHRLCLRERGHRHLQQLHAGLEVRHSGMALPQRRVLRAGQLEGRQQPHDRLRRALLLPHAAVGRDAAGVELHPERVRPQQRGSPLRAGLHRRLPLQRHQPPRHGSGRSLDRHPRWPTRSRIGSSAG